MVVTSEGLVEEELPNVGPFLIATLTSCLPSYTIVIGRTDMFPHSCAIAPGVTQAVGKN